MNLHNYYIVEQFRKLDLDDSIKAGNIKVRGGLIGETNWLTVNYDQLGVIRAILLLNIEDLKTLITHMQWEYPECPSTWEHHLPTTNEQEPTQC